MEIQNFPKLYTSPASGGRLQWKYLFVRFLQKEICFYDLEQKKLKYEVPFRLEIPAVQKIH